MLPGPPGSFQVLALLGTRNRNQVITLSQHPRQRQLARRVRVFVDWLVELCAQPGNDFYRKDSGR
ncbi:hypothetical protein D3C76_848960 [compost metagenome]|nr:hypothetical protein BSF44_53060 [Pseudomonas sp. ACN8]